MTIIVRDAIDRHALAAAWFSVLRTAKPDTRTDVLRAEARRRAEGGERPW